MHSHTVLTTLQIQCSHLHYYGLPDVDRSLSSSFIVELSNSTQYTVHYTTRNLRASTIGVDVEFVCSRRF